MKEKSCSFGLPLAGTRDRVHLLRVKKFEILPINLHENAVDNSASTRKEPFLSTTPPWPRSLWVQKRSEHFWVTMSDKPPPKDWRVLALLLFLLVVIVYRPAMNGGFVFDDDLYITENPLMRSVVGLKQIWFDPQANPQYYPLTFTTFWVEYQLWQLWPTGYHAVNVILHASNAILLWLVLRQLAVPGAWLTAALFALHPVHVESVAWIAERKNVLSGFFYLLALLCYLRFFLVGHFGKNKKAYFWCYYILAITFFSFALLSKTATCSLPVALLCIIWWKRDEVQARDIVLLVPMFVLGLLMGLVTTKLEGAVVDAGGSEWNFSVLDRTLIAGRALWFYVNKLLAPFALTFIYPRWTVGSSVVWWQYLFSLSSFAIPLIVGLLSKKVGKGVTAAVLFFVATLFPTLGFFNVYFMRYSFIADHFQYLASIGILTLVGGLLWYRKAAFSLQLTDDEQALPTRIALLLSTAPYRFFFSCAMLLFLGILTWQQAHLYASPKILWADTVTKNPTSWVAHNNLGIALLGERAYPAAVRQFEEALSLKPDLAEARGNLALAFLRSNQSDAAIKHGKEALRLDPSSSKFSTLLGTAFWHKGDILQAVHYFRLATHLTPTFPQAHYSLGLIYLKEANAFTDDPPHDAVAHFDEAFHIDPESVQVAHALAWTLSTFPDATVRNGARAVQIAEKACEQSDYQDPILLDTLAAAYAETGDFHAALRVAQKAAELAGIQHQQTLVSQITNRLQFYKAGQPYRDTQLRLRDYEVPGL